jgi:hypothetical protein
MAEERAATRERKAALARRRLLDAATAAGRDTRARSSVLH